MADAVSNLVSRVVVVPLLPVYPSTPTPDLPIKITSKFNVERIVYVDGSEQRVLETDEDIINVTLNYKYLSEINRNIIYKFYIERKGALEPFYWVNPVNQNSYIMRFGEDMLNVENFKYKLYNFNEVHFVETHWDY